MNIKIKSYGVSLFVSLLAFISFVVCILFINQEVFYTAHERSEFLYGSPFFETLMSKPFGLFQYIGAWLTQFFYEPALGSLFLVAIWTMIFYVGVKAFKLQNHTSALMLLPIACLLTSVVDLGYWIYILPVKGYWFSQSLGYLVMLLLVWGANRTPRQWHLAWYLLGICLYPILGWFALLFVLCLAVSGKLSWRELIGIVLIFIAANIWRIILYSDLNVHDVMLAGFPRFITPSDVSDTLSVPFIVLGIVSVLIPLGGRYLNKWFVTAVSAIVAIVFTLSFMFNDDNYINEMRMVRSAEVDNWDELLNVVDGNTNQTTSMMMLKNVALMNKGELLERSFKMGGNISVPQHNPDSIHVSLLEISAPIVFYNYGMVNEAIRLNYECAVQSGFSPYYLKLLIRCTIASGEYQLASRFLTMLHNHPFYHDWSPAIVSNGVKELMGCYLDELTGVESSDSYIVNTISLWVDSDSPLAAEQALFYSMIRRDSKRFWTSLKKYVKTHQNEAFHIHAMEAYLLYFDKAPEEKKIMLPVNDQVYARYNKFWETLSSLIKSGTKHSEIPEIMREEWGDTYWYYNIFCTKVY